MGTKSSGLKVCPKFLRNVRITDSAQDPKIFAKIIVDNERLHNQFARLEKRGSDKVYHWGGDPYHM